MSAAASWAEHFAAGIVLWFLAAWFCRSIEFGRGWALLICANVCLAKECADHLAGRSLHGFDPLDLAYGILGAAAGMIAETAPAKTDA